MNKNASPEDIPEAILPSVSMKEANEIIKVYEGDFVLKGEVEFALTGTVYFKWFPSLGCSFSASGTSCNVDLVKAFQGFGKFKLLIEGVEFGDCFLTQLSGNFYKDYSLEGVLEYEAIRGDKTIPVNKVRFAIPNLRDITGDSVKYSIEESTLYRKARLQLENNDYTIIIDQVYHFDKLFRDSLKKKGGYLILYSGELNRKKGDIRYKDTEDVFLCLSKFLSFMNGRKVSPMFRQGLFGNEAIWTDYKAYHVDTYESAPTWLSRHSYDGLNLLWKNFCVLWKNEDDREFLMLAIHWYLEANSNSGSENGAIILAQTGLELIYNWLLIETKKLLVGKDAENISASNKIRLLLSHLNVSNNTPEGFDALQAYIDSDQTIADAPDAFVNIRNTIVHSQMDKRKKLSNMSNEVKQQALDLGIWYIELSLLYLLGYRGMYINRCSNNQSIEQTVPWS